MRKNSKIESRNQYVLPYAANYKHKLDIIENQYPPSVGVSRAIVEAASSIATTAGANPLCLYPSPTLTYFALLARIAKYTSSDTFNTTTDNIILTNGSDNALKLICDCWAYDGAKIVAPVPTYPHFLMFAETSPGYVVKPNITINSTSSEVIDIVRGNIQDAAICYLVTPNMPLGYILEPSHVETLLIEYPDTLFVIDEAYFEYGGKTCVSLIDYKNIIITRTFSKAFGLASLRVGYLLAHKDITTYMRKCVNEKNVTPIAVAAANAALYDIAYYNTKIAETEREKDRLRGRYAAICSAESAIYGCHIAGGNFYTIFAKDPAAVYDEFAREGIFIRNKHSDIPNGLRIMIGRPDQNDDVVKIVRKINAISLHNADVICDLDNTLRWGSKNTTEPYAGANIIERLNVVIMTNNCSYTPSEISEYFAAYNIKIEPARIISPLVIFAELAKQYKDYVVYGRAAAQMLNGGVFSDNTQAVFLAADYFLSAEDHINIAKLGARGGILYYPYSDTHTTLSEFPETTIESDLEIPDIGSIVRSLRIKTKMIGKPTLCMYEYYFKNSRRPKIVIGDGESDRGLAKAINALFIHIDKSNTIGEVSQML